MRPFARQKRQILTHRIRHDQNVRKQDGAIEAETAQRLQGDLCCCLAVIDQRQEPALLRAKRAIFRKIAPGLPHQPDGTAREVLSFEGGEQRTGHCESFLIKEDS
jgi:hypothetical protein